MMYQNNTAIKQIEYSMINLNGCKISEFHQRNIL